jgi:hypothetical membrane protein
MTTIIAARTRIITAGATRASSATLALAGTLLALAGAVILMGIITAEALYPAAYTTHDNEISDLGATRPPDSIILQPSAGIFDGVMIATGIAIIVGALLLHRGYGTKRVTISMGLLGTGVLGVGIFPGDKDPYHGIFALIAFVAGGFAALLSARVQAAPLRYLSMLLGAITLGSLVLAMFTDSTVIYRELGDGGIERWIAYPVVLWLVAFGASLMSSGARDPVS